MTQFGKASFLFLLLTASLLAAQDQHVDNPGQTPMKPMQAGPTGQAVVTGNGINYNGGPVLKGNPVPFYLIWYGNWNGTGSNTQATVSLVEHFVGTVGKTPYQDIDTTYGDSTGNASGNVSLGGAIFDGGSQGASLTNTKLSSIVARAVTGGLPLDGNGVYFVLTSSNVSEQGFCTQFCSFHTHQTINGVDIKWVFIGNPDRCSSACERQTTGPNSPAINVGGGDGIIFELASQDFNAITDPDQNAWLDSSGGEAGSKCISAPLPESTCAPGSGCTAAGDSAQAKFNVVFGGTDYLLPEIWENANGGKCVLHL